MMLQVFIYNKRKALVYRHTWMHYSTGVLKAHALTKSNAMRAQTTGQTISTMRAHTAGLDVTCHIIFGYMYYQVTMWLPFLLSDNKRSMLL